MNWSPWVLLLLLAPLMPANATSAEKQQRSMGDTKVYTEQDLGKLTFLVGRWSGTAPDGTIFYEEYSFDGPGTFRSRRYENASFATSTDGSTVTLKDGALISTWGAFTWQAESVDDGLVTFKPLQAPSSFSWRRIDPDTVEVTQSWTDEKGEPQRYALRLTRIR